MKLSDLSIFYIFFISNSWICDEYHNLDKFTYINLWNIEFLEKRNSVVKNYILKYFDIRLLELMRIIMIYDSSSHSLLSQDSWVPEINKNIDLLRKKLFDKDK